MIVTDMDGSLLNDAHELPANFWEIEQALHSQGIKFAVASGRQYYNLLKNFKSLEDRMIFFAENGTYVVFNGEQLLIQPLPTSEVKKFILLGRELPETDIVLCGKKCAYIESKNEKFYQEIKQFYEKLEVVDDLIQVEDDFLKVTYCNFNGVENTIMPKLEEYEENFKVAIAAKIFIDITSREANKGNAIKGIQKKLNITPEETMVFGDYLNDLEMMQNCPNSYAMKNSHPDIIKASNYITTYTNNENGVMRTIQKLGLLEKSSV